MPKAGEVTWTMPIYEFYCPGCHMIFSFFSKSINTTKRPYCPKCRKRRLKREVSVFACTGGAKEDDASGELPLDESKLENAITKLAGEAENISEDDPRQAARLMRKFSSMTGMEFGEGMEQAIDRMEAGEDPESIEAEMGDLMNEEDPFVIAGGRKGKGRRKTPPARDEKLYDL